MTAIGDAFMQVVRRKYSEAERRILIHGVGAAYDHIMFNWPVYTGFSKANNRISITGQPITRVEPNKRPTKQMEGALVGKAEAVHASEKAKLARIEQNFGMKNRRIILGNSVSYASDVSFEPGRGVAIYAAAAEVAKQTMNAVKGIKS